MNKAFVESKRFIFIIHILVWTTFLLLQIVFFQSSFENRPPELFDRIQHGFYQRFSIQSVIIIALFYVNYLILTPKYLFKKRIITYIVYIVICLIVSYFIEFFVVNYFELRPHFFPRPFQISLFLPVFIIVLSTSIKLLQKWFEGEAQRKQLKTEKLNSELSSLKSQVNPHFLFNTLNGIYSLAYAKSDKTAHAIVMLSQLMRYMLDESKNKYVELASEIEYISTFIELQKLRLFDNVIICFNVDGNDHGIKIQPLLLIPFIENAFKHGTDSKSNCTIEIKIKITNGSLQLIVINDIVKSSKLKEKSGLGLHNIKRRLELEYGDKHELIIDRKENKFIVKLNLLFK